LIDGPFDALAFAAELAALPGPWRSAEEKRTFATVNRPEFRCVPTIVGRPSAWRVHAPNGRCECARRMDGNRSAVVIGLVWD
jgi:hypothetical protein